MKVSFKSPLFFIATPLAVGYVAEGHQEAVTITGVSREMIGRSDQLGPV